MDNVQVVTIDLDGKEYFLVDSVNFEKDNYHFFANSNNNEDIIVMKDKEEDGEMFYVTVDSDTEYDQAFALYFNKLKN